MGTFVLALFLSLIVIGLPILFLMSVGMVIISSVNLAVLTWNHYRGHEERIFR